MTIGEHPRLAGSEFAYLIRDYHGSKKILGGGQAKEYSRVRFPRALRTSCERVKERLEQASLEIPAQGVHGVDGAAELLGHVVWD